ncbi:MAG TPA: phosphatidate cytidylyltransferase [Blastocatellia bacterium]|nr:phosphatidate cytidylyltransferase [Blastocatellia bacterium]
MKRILTALVAIPILLFTVWVETPYYFVGITAAAAVVALTEFYALASQTKLKTVTAAGYAAGALIVYAFVADRPALIVVAIAGLALVALTVAVVTTNEMSAALASVSASVFGVVYAVLLPAYLVGVRMIPDSSVTPPVPHLAAKLLTMFLAMVMMTDTGAYYTGRSIGRHKLAPRVSPGKTIEGSVGGFVAATLSGLVCKLAFFPEIQTLHAVAFGAVIGVVSQIGDLAESILKRGAGVKDSGRIFPGHGGMLDRMDSILFCAPILYYYSRYVLPAA